ncbi:hypothetical protein D9M68_144230 [compost metagenome]
MLDINPKATRRTSGVAAPTSDCNGAFIGGIAASATSERLLANRPMIEEALHCGARKSRGSSASASIFQLRPKPRIQKGALQRTANKSFSSALVCTSEWHTPQ